MFWGSIIIITVITLLLVFACSNYFFKKRLIPPIAEYAKKLGNVPTSFTHKHFKYYAKHHRNDINNYHFLKEKNTTEIYGFMMVAWYLAKLVEFQLLPNYFEQLNALIGKPQERDQIIANIKSSDEIAPKQLNELLLQLKYIGRHSDDEAAAFIGQLYLDGQHLPQNIYLGLLWYLMALEHKDTQAYTVKTLRLMQQHPQLKIDDNKWLLEIEQEIYQDIFSHIPYLEDWEERIDDMYKKIKG